MSRRRLSLLFFALCGVWAVLAARLFMVQIWFPPEGRDGFAPREIEISGPRGTIYDRNAEPLALSRKVWGLYLDAGMAEDSGVLPTLYDRIKHFAPVGRDEFYRLMSSRRRYIRLPYEFEAAEAARIRSLGIPGVGLEERAVRVYPEGELARDILGVCGPHSMSGVELTYNSNLAGKAFAVRRRRDGAGRHIPDDVYFEETASGDDVYLTIDKNIQYMAESAAADALERHNAQSVVIIVQEPSSGEILASAARRRKPSARIAPIGENYEPGSTFKLFTYGLALSEGAVRGGDELIDCENGKYEVYGHRVTDHEKRGVLTVREAFAFSSNVACVKIGQRFSREKIQASVRNYGFGTRTGINLPGEERGLLPAKWDPFTTLTVTYGHGIAVTPLQLVNGYSAVANGGWLMEPQIVAKTVSSPPRRIVRENRRRVVRRVADEKTAAALMEMLGDVVGYGTGRSAAVPGYKIGGKTGTAQKRDTATGRYSKKDYVASFCGVIPLDEPKLSILVVVDSPSGGDFWGSTIAAPVFARVASAAAAYLRIPPSHEGIKLVSSK